jgi:hypothetical protein
MRRQLPAAARPLLVFLCSITAVSAQELIGNGGFEEGRLLPWAVQEAAGSAVRIVSENSAFGPGASAVQMTDDDSDFEQPGLVQTFEAQAVVLFAFDFKFLGGEENSPWYVAWQGENRTTAFFFSVGGLDGRSIELNQARIAALKTNVWYHVEGFADAPHQSVKGVLRENGGAETAFESGFPFGVKETIGAVEVSDGDAARNSPMLLDNFSARAISLAITPAPAGQIITWAAADFRLQSTAQLGPGAAWADLASGAGIYTNTSPDAVRFFRLIR